MADISSIEALLARGWSHRKIARELGLHRETVGRHATLLGCSVSKPAKVTAGSDSPPSPEPKPAKVTAGSATRRSLCEAYRASIEGKLDHGLHAQRIYQDLKAETDFSGSYESVKRFVRSLQGGTALPFRRLEVGPGEEGQVDFGKGAFVDRPGKPRRRPHLFRIVLSYSRKGYSEVVWRQDTETFIRCLENAFRAFGGVPSTLVLDNLKAAVLKADWFDPEINPKFQSFARHYGFAILPNRPYTPRHKGKVEAGVDYVQENALKGRTYEALDEQNRYLLEWERQVADTRIHGTIRRQVRDLFENEERSRLRALPSQTFPCFEEGERRVHRDGHIAVANAYYSVPPEFVGKPVWVRWDTRLVRIYSTGLQQIAIHPRVEPGHFQTEPGHIDPRKIAVVEKGACYLLGRVRLIGTYSAAWSEALLEERGVEGLRTLQGFLSLTQRVSSAQLERVAEIALDHRLFRLKPIRSLLADPAAPVQLQFIEHHPVIRDMSEYQSFVHDALTSRKETQ